MRVAASRIIIRFHFSFVNLDLQQDLEIVLYRLFPVVIFIDGVISSVPPPVYILLLIKVTLGQQHITLDTCPASLILSTSRCRVS